MLSIIIPTLNEEQYLPELLSFIRTHCHQNHEVIVSDGKSTDKTADIARVNGCTVVTSSMRSPAHQRNRGAEAANGDTLLFLDADTRLPEGFFQTVLGEFDEKSLDLGNFYFIFHSSKFIYRLASLNALLHLYIFHFFQPFGVGAAMLVRKSAHDAVGGFDESIVLGEDYEYCKSIRRHGFRCSMLTSSRIFFSTRRLDKVGPWKMLAIWYLLMARYAVFGPIRTHIVRYPFGAYNSNDE